MPLPDRIRRVLRGFTRPTGSSEDGGVAVEYALLAGLVALAIVGALGNVGNALRNLPLPALINAFESVL